MNRFFDDSVDFDEFELSDLTYRELFYNEAKHYIKQKHYSHTISSGVKVSLGFFYKSELVTVIAYGSPVGRRVTEWLQCDYDNCLELVRMYSEDGLPKNTESYCLGKSFDYIKKNYPQYKYLISYADPNFGHVGTVYQATNWYYVGEQRRLLPPRQIFIDGKEVHTRTLNEKHKSTADDFLRRIYGDRIEIKSALRKYVYLMCLGNKRERREWYSKFEQKPYPKNSPKK